jgi:uncharacterized repeat protein (TIGR03803 family)
MAVGLAAQTISPLFSFDGTNGQYPAGALIQGVDGNLYGTTEYDGANGGGTIFKTTPAGGHTTLYNFCSQTGCADGAEPYAALTLASNGDLYGVTSQGGVSSNCTTLFGCGTLFKITPAGALTTLYTFCSQVNCADGSEPFTQLVLTGNGDLYGTTQYGGANPAIEAPGSTAGTIFKITPSGTLTTVYNFCSQTNCADGELPDGLIQSANGDFYGTTGYGGANKQGTFFELTPAGTLTTLYNFCSDIVDHLCADGSQAALTGQAADGDFYGVARYGSANGKGGTIFKVTPGGTLTTLYSFCAKEAGDVCLDGQTPNNMVLASDGNYFGTTYQGGSAAQAGTIFEMTPSGTLTTLYVFCSEGGGCAYGQEPLGAPFQATNGEFYGTTTYGGLTNDGELWSLSVGLGAFVETLPTFGKVGEAVQILGTDLTRATSVTFNGAAAAFTVVSATQIKTTVPAGANTGRIRVVTPGGTLSTVAPFVVP